MEPRVYTIGQLMKLWKSREEVQRRQFLLELEDIYHNRWKGRLRHKIAQSFSKGIASKLEPMIDTSLNLGRWTSDELGKIYSKPPIRYLTRNGEKVDDSLADYEGPLTNVAFNTAAKKCQLYREMGLRPRAENGRLRWELIPPSRILAIPSPIDPLKLDVVVVQKDGPDKKPNYVIYTTEFTARLDEHWKPFLLEENTYGVIPYYVVHADYPTTMWNSWESQSLRDATYSTGIALTDFRHTHRLQSYKQIVIKGTSEEKLGVVATDPSRVLFLPNTGQDATTLDLQTDTGRSLGAALDAAGAAINLKGMNPAAMKGSLDASSGYALKLKMHSQEEVWREYRVLWSLWEEHLYEIARAVALVDSSGKLQLPEGQMVVEFADIGPGQSPGEQASIWTQAIQGGWESAQSIMRQQGKTEDEISTIFNERLEEAMMAQHAQNQANDAVWGEQGA